MRFFTWWRDRKYPDAELNWHECAPPMIPRRTVDGGWTSTELYPGKTWRRRGMGGKWEYRQDPQAAEDLGRDQW